MDALTRIKLCDIGRDGLSRTIRLLPSDLKRHFPLSDTIRDAIDEPLLATVEIRLIGDTVDLRGTVILSLFPECDLCMTPFRFKKVVTVNHMLVSQRRAAPGTETHDGVAFDLKPILLEYVALNLPYAFHCTPDCKGICAQCGNTRESGACTCYASPDQVGESLLSQLDPNLH